jgi:hypothetical protein
MSSAVIYSGYYWQEIRRGQNYINVHSTFRWLQAVLTKEALVTDAL